MRAAGSSDKHVVSRSSVTAVFTCCVLRLPGDDQVKTLAASEAVAAMKQFNEPPAERSKYLHTPLLPAAVCFAGIYSNVSQAGERFPHVRLEALHVVRFTRVRYEDASHGIDGS